MCLLLWSCKFVVAGNKDCFVFNICKWCFVFNIALCELHTTTISFVFVNVTNYDFLNLNAAKHVHLLTNTYDSSIRQFLVDHDSFSCTSDKFTWSPSTTKSRPTSGMFKYATNTSKQTETIDGCSRCSIRWCKIENMLVGSTMWCGNWHEGPTNTSWLYCPQFEECCMIIFVSVISKISEHQIHRRICARLIHLLSRIQINVDWTPSIYFWDTFQDLCAKISRIDEVLVTFTASIGIVFLRAPVDDNASDQFQQSE